VGRVGHSARILRPPHPVGLGNLPDPRVRVGRANPIGLKPDPTITLFEKKSRSDDNFSRILLRDVMLLILNVLSYINFRLTNKKIFCSFVSKCEYVFNRYVVASLSQQILDNNVIVKLK